MSIKSNKFSVFGLASSLVFISLISAGLYLFLLTKKTVTDGGVVISNEEEIQQERRITNTWIEFINEEFGYRISHPPLLTKTEYKNEGGYKDFIRFEENEKSLGRGIGIGVRESTLRDEVERLKKEMDQFKGSKLTKETKLPLSNYNGFVLEYDTVDNSDTEAKAIILIQKDNFIYSISTVPEQIDRVISSFSFL